MDTVSCYLKKASEFLSKKNIDTCRLDSEILYCAAADIDKVKMLCSLNDIPYNEIIENYRKLIVERGKRIPIAYLINKKEFYGYEFSVDENCLIPRPETEQIIDIILKEFDCDSELKIIDLCCGPGTIILTLLQKFSDKTSGIAVDNNIKTLEVLMNNVEKFSLLNRLKIFSGDVLENDFYNNEFLKNTDILVCNPPYISEQIYETLAPEVKFEPKSALVAENNGLDFYIKIINNLDKILKPSGVCYFEISEDIKSELESLFTDRFDLKFFYGYNNKVNVMRVRL